MKSFSYISPGQPNEPNREDFVTVFYLPMEKEPVYSNKNQDDGRSHAH
jgi:hypothetical protein